MIRNGFRAIATGAAVALFGLLAFGSAASADPYISMGDSTSTSSTNGGSSTYVDLLFGGFGTHPGFDETLGADEHIALAQAGQVLSGLKSQQLPTAISEINAADDTRAVTIAIGGNDALGGESCFGEATGCAAFQASYDDMVSQIRNALENDPGTEYFGLLSYYNPYKREGSGISLEDQQNVDRKLLGTNLQADQCAVETSTGLNDIAFQAGSAFGAVVADPYVAFLAGGNSFFADAIHANGLGNVALAESFLDPVGPFDCDPPPEPNCETDPSLCPVVEDRVAPRTTLVSLKRKGKRTVTFRFRSSEEGSFRCSIDGRAFSRCTSPKTLRGLKKGRHVFRVKAVDLAGNQDQTPVRRVFRIHR
ncbi:MAG: SGNH/GDSL hydrolase family protein [Solirubrobacterales bacterium]|nr:SGNH/GDSL hydrolase family protein [Solirubrobacterales bacterium]